MTTTKAVAYTVRCDDGRYCRNDKGDTAIATVHLSNKRQVHGTLRAEGWTIRYGIAAQCPACVRHVRGYI